MAAPKAAAQPAAGPQRQPRGAAMPSRPLGLPTQISKMYEGPRDTTKSSSTACAKPSPRASPRPNKPSRISTCAATSKLDALLKFRSERSTRNWPRAGSKLSVNDFVIKACAAGTASKCPTANAMSGRGIGSCKLTPSDVAVAVAIEGGLFTPVLKDADTKSLSALSTEMKDLATRARDRKLAPHEYQGGSFAISNLGMFGIDNFDAVINPPHGAILAVGAGTKKPVINSEGEVEVATVMSVTLSVDHRVIDGVCR